MTSTDPDTATAQRLLRAIIALSPYAKRLAPLEAEVIRIALANRQLSASLASVYARHQSTDRLRLRDLGDERKTFEAFLEQIYFASPAFLRSVGEWPPGEVRG